MPGLGCRLHMDLDLDPGRTKGPSVTQSVSFVELISDK